jgi:aldose 1-epimerase
MDSLNGIRSFFLQNTGGLSLRVLDYGCRITELWAPDADGRTGNVILGFGNPEDYITDRYYLGACIGRYANYIAGGRFVLNGRVYELETNDGPHTLHGGPRGFHQVMWETAGIKTDKEPSITFTHTSPAGEGGFPGTVRAAVEYTLSEKNELIIRYTADTDAPTPLSLTNHCYFNLSAGPDKTIEGHRLRINADAVTDITGSLLPTGKIRPVAGTVFDFTSPKPIGRDINADDALLRQNNGYDINYVLQGSGMRAAADLYDPSSGRGMKVLTDMPGLQIYTANDHNHRAVCLETQFYPDSPNHKNFPSCIIKPGIVFHSSTAYCFYTRRAVHGESQYA